MNIVLDIAATLSAVIWPVVVLVLLLVYRSQIPSLIGGVARRVSKLELPGFFSLELAQAKAFAPDWKADTANLDLRHQATSVQVSDSTQRMFLQQLIEDATGDFAVINLGTGGEWLTSRLFIMAILFGRMKGIRCFVFLDKAPTISKHFVGWAEPERIRWALAKRYPWFEREYADAYSTVTRQVPDLVIVSHQGRLGYSHNPRDPGSSIELLKEFLQRVQTQLPPSPPTQPVPPNQWVSLESAENTWEHANWLNAELLEEALGDDLHTSAVRSTDLRSKTKAEQMTELLSVSSSFIPVVADDKKFEYLVKREVLVEQIAKMMGAQTGIGG